MRHARLVIGSILLAAAAVVSASCGARSSLEHGAAASGSTGGGRAGSGGGVIVVSSSSSTSGSGGGGHGGSGGSGGAACGFGGAGIGGTPVVDACSAIAPQAAILAIGDGNGVEDVGPTLVHLADTAPTVGAIYVEEFKTFQSSARVTAFDAWGAWPPTASPPASIEDAHGHAISPDLGLLAADHAPVDGREFSLLYSKLTAKQKPYDTFAIGFGACGRPGGDETHFLYSDGTPICLVPSPDRLGVLGFVSKFTSPYYVVEGTFTGPGAYNLFDLGCATSPVFASAVTTATGWIFGIAAGTPFDGQKLGCNEKPGPIGPTTYLTVAVLDQAPQPPGTEQLRPNGSLQASGMITSLAFVPTSDGARAIWGVGAALSTATLDATAAILTTGSLDMGAVPIDASAIDAAPLGGGFAVAAPTSAASIHVGLFDASGALVGSADVPLGAPVNGRLRALASPAGDKLLVAWSQQAADADATLHVARFDCASP